MLNYKIYDVLFRFYIYFKIVVKNWDIRKYTCEAVTLNYIKHDIVLKSVSITIYFEPHIEVKFLNLNNSFY